MDFNLSIEEQFKVRRFSDQARDMNRQQTIDLLIEVYTHMLRRESLYKDLIKQSWGIDDDYVAAEKEKRFFEENS